MTWLPCDEEALRWFAAGLLVIFLAAALVVMRRR